MLYNTVLIYKRLYFYTLANAEKEKQMQLHKSLKIFRIVIVTGSSTSTYLSCLFSLTGRLEIKVHPGISAKYKSCTELFDYMVSN